MTEATMLMAFVGVVLIITGYVERWGWKRINDVANSAPKDNPHEGCEHGQHHVVTCATCGQFVDLHNGYEVLHHQVPGHAPETIQ